MDIRIETAFLGKPEVVFEDEEEKLSISSLVQYRKLYVDSIFVATSTSFNYQEEFALFIKDIKEKQDNKELNCTLINI